MSQKTVEIMVTVVAVAIIAATTGYILWKEPLLGRPEEPDCVVIPEYYNVDPLGEPDPVYEHARDMLQRFETVQKDQEIIAQDVQVEAPGPQSP